MKFLKRFKKKNFRHIIRKKGRDLSKSCIEGFKKARFKSIIVMDGDLQHKPSDIKKILYKFFRSNPDFVIGTRAIYLRKKNIILIF